MKKLKTIPRFKTEKEEREFWWTHDSTKYVDWSQAVQASYPNIKLSTKPITIRLPVGMIDRLKIRAAKTDVPYQSLIKESIFDFLSR